MTMTNSFDLAAKAGSLAGQLAALDDERQRLSLQSQEGVLVARRALSDLDVVRGEIAAEIDQVQQARHAAQQREAVAARAQAQMREAEREAQILAKKARIHITAETADAVIVALRDALIAHREACDDARLDSSDPVLFGHYYSEVAPRVLTVLAGSGFGFQRLPFCMTDEKGRPDAGEQALVKKAPDYLLKANLNNAA